MGILKNKSISSKLYLTMAVSIALTTVIGMFSLYCVFQINTSYIKMIEQYSGIETDIEVFENAFNLALLELHVVPTANDEDELTSIKNNSTAYQSEMQTALQNMGNKISGLPNQSNMLSYINAIQTNFTLCEDISLNIFALKEQDDDSNAFQLLSDLRISAVPIHNALAGMSSEMQSYLIMTSQSNNSGAFNYIIIAFIISGLIAVAFACYIRLVIKSFKDPVNKLIETANAVSRGDLSTYAQIESKEEFGTLGRAFDEMLNAFKKQAEVLEYIAQGDMTSQIELRSEDDAVNGAIQQILDKNNQAMLQIGKSAQEVAQGANQISAGAQSLASGSMEQAASVEELSATIENLLVKTAANASSAQEALDLTITTEDTMQKSMVSMEEMTRAMHDIDESSSNITKVIKVIDDIAFQTNILALNASVEAARAGQHGKGFAVVADEVRSLAAKSAEAAQETTALIEDSRSKVQDGNAIVDRTEKDIRIVSQLAEKNHILIESIATDAEEQAAAMAQLNAGVEQISEVTQANSANAEEAAATAQEMAAQADVLAGEISYFKLTQDDDNDILAIGP